MMIISGAKCQTPAVSLVAVHTWHNESSRYERFAAAMPEVTVHSLHPPTPETVGDMAMPRRVDQWIDHHEASLRALPVEPPYRLVGWSFGGVVAVELARRLRAQGTAVTFVGMIDSIRPIRLPLSDREYLWYHIGAASTMDPSVRGQYLRRKIAYLALRRYPRTVGAMRAVFARAGLVNTPTGGPKPKVTDPLMVSIHTAYLNYDGDPIDFPVSLYTTAGSVRRCGNPALRWLEHLHGGYELTAIPGGHFTLWDPPNVERVAAAVREGLRRNELAAPWPSAPSSDPRGARDSTAFAGAGPSATP